VGNIQTLTGRKQQQVRKNCMLGSFRIVFSICYGDQIKDEMVKAHGTHAKEERYSHGFGTKT
jgi:hypothetical protein